MVDKVEALEAHLQRTQEDVESLQGQVVLSEKRLARAGKLMSALGDEAVRWSQTAEEIAGCLAAVSGQN